jgi:uncharacterized protein (DUF486 family)
MPTLLCSVLTTAAGVQFLATVTTSARLWGLIQAHVHSEMFSQGIRRLGYDLSAPTNAITHQMLSATAMQTPRGRGGI